VTGYDYVRRIGEYYLPKTPRAALRAVEFEFVPVEAFIYKSSSSKSLFEEPYDLAELDRVLARKNLDLGEAMLLTEIFWSMTHGHDKEIALFAAESLIALENRWARRIEELGALVNREACSGETCLSYARALYEYALIAGQHGPIKNYYLREAYYTLSQRTEACDEGGGFALRLRCLLRLGLLDQAEAILHDELCRRDDDEILLLALETAYRRKDTARIRALLEGRDVSAMDLPEELIAALEAWKA
jgi:hypothetical protein